MQKKGENKKIGALHFYDRITSSFDKKEFQIL